MEPPRLQPPGTGIPTWQVMAGKYFYLPWWCLRHTWESVPDEMDSQGQRLLGDAASLGEDELQRRVLIAPLVGIEDSSRYNSYCMVLEHLAIVGNTVAGVLVELCRGQRPAKVFKVAEVKARGLASPAVVFAGYREMLAAFRRAALESCEDRRSRTRYEHPWFGPLDAYQWLCFTSLHQVVHLKQTRAILRALRPRG
jgi:hypothetical protein